MAWRRGGTDGEGRTLESSWEALAMLPLGEEEEEEGRGIHTLPKRLLANMLAMMCLDRESDGGRRGADCVGRSGGLEVKASEGEEMEDPVERPRQRCYMSGMPVVEKDRLACRA